MDFELEMGTIIAQGNQMGHPIKVNDAKNHIFGYTLLNDWSARDL
jgi:fumarylacetoacetase